MQKSNNFRVKVKNMTSPKTGNPVANQFIVAVYPKGKGLSEDSLKASRLFFQSYDSIIAMITNDEQVVLDKNFWDYSRTTGKYRNQFLNEGIAETRKKIKEGIYALDDLNA